MNQNDYGWRKTMNPTMDQIHQHRSIRKYKSDPISKDLIESIVSAGQRASTSSNLQMYSVVVTTALEDRRLLARLCGNQAHINDAPVFLTWCADLSRLERVCLAGGYDHQSGYVENFILAVVDAAIASQNAGLAAESLGLGFCYIGGIRNNPEEVIKLLKLPRLVFPLVGMTLGWPQGDSMIRPRLPLDAVISWDHYSTENEGELLEVYDQLMLETGIYHGREIDKSSTANIKPYSWSEHSARRVSKVLRPHLKQVLENIGFLMK
jgi:FMN reductase (NADPH)